MAGLQTTYRPRSFKTFVGNAEVITSLQSVLQREKPPSAFLLTGAGGCGKTTLGRIIRKELKCEDTDFKELNAADERGIDGMRKLISDMKFVPYGKTKVYLLDEAHMILKPSQEILLKAIEEPPPYMHWIICTTNPEALKPTFKRRCHTYELKRLLDSDLQRLMKRVLKKEKRENISTEVRNKIIELADGSAGIALKLLDQVIDMDEPERALATLSSAGTGDTEVITLCRVLVSNMPAKTKWAKLKVLLKDLKTDGESARRPIAGYLSSVLLNNGGIEIAYMMEHFEKNFFDSGKAGLTLACYKACFEGE